MSRNRAVVSAVAAVVVVVVGLAVLLVLRTTGNQQAAPPFPGPTIQPPSNGPVEQSQPPRPSPVVDETDLQRQVDADHAVAEGLVGNWVPQLSSKRLGLAVRGVTFGYPAILADFQMLHARFPQAVLIRSDDYSTYPRPGYWVTVVAETYPSANAANAWCAANDFAADDCYAHRLSHTDGPAGSSKPR